MTKFAIVTNTYKRQDGKTPKLLERAMKSVLNQTHSEWKLFLIGDKYEDDREFRQLSTIIPAEKIMAINRLDATIERDIYPMPSRKLWCCAGLSSTRYGIELALKEGYEFVCKLDHDDWWEETHLSDFNKALEKHPELFFLASRSTHIGKDPILPPLKHKAGIGYFPQPKKVINSSTCIKYSETKIRSRDTFQKKGKAIPADLDLWKRLKLFMNKKNKKGYLCDNISCHHDDQGHALK